MGEEKPAKGLFNSPNTHMHARTHNPRLQVQAASQLGARASLELSLRSWLRLASRSLSSVSSCVCNVCASMRRDSLCSTVDRQVGMGDYQTTCHPTTSRPSTSVPQGAVNTHPTLHCLGLCSCFLQSHFLALGSYWLCASIPLR